MSESNLREVKLKENLWERAIQCQMGQEHVTIVGFKDNVTDTQCQSSGKLYVQGAVPHHLSNPTSLHQEADLLQSTEWQILESQFTSVCSLYVADTIPMRAWHPIVWRIVRLFSVTDKLQPWVKGRREACSCLSLTQTWWMEVHKLCVRGCWRRESCSSRTFMFWWQNRILKAQLPRLKLFA